MASKKQIERFNEVISPIAFAALGRIAEHLVGMGLTVSEVRSLSRVQGRGYVFSFEVRQGQSRRSAYVELDLWDGNIPSIIAWSNQRGTWGMDLWDRDVSYEAITTYKRIMARFEQRYEEIAEEISNVVPGKSVMDWRPEEPGPSMGGATEEYVAFATPLALEALAEIAKELETKGHRTGTPAPYLTGDGAWSFYLDEAKFDVAIHHLSSVERPEIRLSNIKFQPIFIEDLWPYPIDWRDLVTTKEMFRRVGATAKTIADVLHQRMTESRSVLHWRPGDEKPPSLGAAKSPEGKMEKFLRLVEPSAIEAMDEIALRFESRGYRTDRVIREMVRPTVQWTFDASRNHGNSMRVIFWLMSGFKPLVYIAGGGNVRGVAVGDRPLYLFEIEEAIAVCRDVIHRADEIVNRLLSRNPGLSVLDWRPPVE